MDISYFREGLEEISHVGIRLTPEQLALIESSLILLQNENKFQDIFFWGKINGIANDYYIAFGYMQDCLNGRKFFYSINCYNWYLLPPYNSEFTQICLLCPTKLYGDPGLVTEVMMDPVFTFNEITMIRNEDQITKNIKEEDRLSVIVSMITEESAIVPRGALYKQVDRKVVYNKTFKGLTRLEAEDLINYQLYRKQINKWNENLLTRQDYNFPTDFFDTVYSIVPEEKSFSITFDTNNELVFVKSLYWLGMTFYHRLGTTKHGFVYFGDGKKNMDILFMTY